MRYKQGWQVDEGLGDIDYFPEETYEMNGFTVSISCSTGEVHYWPSLADNDNSRECPISDLFQDVLNPTPEELALFELEFGVNFEGAVAIMNEPANIANWKS